jgi:HEAT repeat protein
MKTGKLSRIPQFVRSIFLPRKSTSPATALLMQSNRVSDMNAADGVSVAAVLREVTNIDALIVALRSPCAETARDAAIELGRAGDPLAVEPLIQVLANQQGYFHGVVRSAAATSLGQLKDARAVDSLIVATGDPMAEVSEEATLALGAINDARAIEPLMNIVSNRAGFFLTPVRRAAIKSLGEFRDARVASMLLSVSVNDEEDPIVRQAAKDVGSHR